MRQLSLNLDPRKNTKLWWIAKRGVYGGSLNYRKVRRPFDSKKLTHSVFKASLGQSLRFTRFEKRVREILQQAAARYGVKVRDCAINHDHIHVLFYTKTAESQTQFLRFFAAEMGRRYASLREKMGMARRPLWSARPFTRLVSWGKKSLSMVQNYIRRNRDEAMGFVMYTPRRHALTAFLHSWSVGGGMNSG